MPHMQKNARWKVWRERQVIWMKEGNQGVNTYNITLPLVSEQ